MAQLVNGVLVATIPFNLEQLQAVSDSLSGKRQVRMNPEETWTALKHMELLNVINAELALLRAEECLSKKLLSY